MQTGSNSLYFNLSLLYLARHRKTVASHRRALPPSCSLPRGSLQRTGIASNLACVRPASHLYHLAIEFLWPTACAS
jgi:hypothetical protein